LDDAEFVDFWGPARHGHVDMNVIPGYVLEPSLHGSIISV
jgi:hypothetical protein